MKILCLTQVFCLIACLLVSALYLSGCSSVAPSASLPSWVLRTPKGCGMGSVRVSGPLSLAKTGAIARGRDALARELQTRIESVIRTYKAEGHDAQGQELSEELLVDVSQQSSRAMLRGTRDREIFLSQGTPRVLYALVCYETLKKPGLVKVLSRLPRVYQAPIRERAEASFAELEELMKTYD